MGRLDRGWGRAIRIARQQHLWSVKQLARRLIEEARASGVNAPTLDSAIRAVRRWEAGENYPDDINRWLLAKVFATTEDLLFGIGVSGGFTSPDQAGVWKNYGTPAGRSLFGLDEVELVRQGLHGAITESTMTEASLDDWEQLVQVHGRAARQRPAAILLVDLSADLSELRSAVAKCRTSSGLRRLVRVVAQMAGLMCLTLIKLDERAAFRSWARTARVAAEEAGDPTTCAWVGAQEAYGHYYSGDLSQAIDVARHAQTYTGSAPSVGSVLAAALEGRCYAALGRREEMRDALHRTETVLAHLDSNSMVATAFGYNEAQLRFHEGNAFTHLRDTRSAWKAQERALELCPPSDYMDRVLTQLDRATCLVHDGDVFAGVSYAAEALAGLSDKERGGIIAGRGREMIELVPAQYRSLSAVLDLTDLLALQGETEDKEP